MDELSNEITWESVDVDEKIYFDEGKKISRNIYADHLKFNGKFAYSKSSWKLSPVL